MSSSRTPRKGGGTAGGSKGAKATPLVSPTTFATPLATLATTLRTASCGDLRATDVGREVILTGWVAHRRDYGKLIFIDLRDRFGLTQVVFDPERSPEAAAAHQVANEARLEYVLRVKGLVTRRLPGKENPSLSTGDIEVEAHHVELLNPAKVSPFPIADHVTADEALRLRYRYLDMRRETLRHNIELRHRAVKYIRDYMDERGFLESRDTYPDQEHAGGRARLPGAEPSLSRRVLRAATGAAAVQATAHGRRYRSLFPDRPLFP